jgi:hypothetical protein
MKDLISHIFIHEGYEMNGYKQMTTGQKILYREIVLETTNIDIFENEAHKNLTNFKTVAKMTKTNAGSRG